jgi:DNA-binding transcriptional ArsR family regulator
VAAKLAIGVESRAHLRRLSVVFAVELRLKIVAELYMREMSPKQFYEEFGGGSIPRVNQHFAKLAETGWLRRVWSEGPGGKRFGSVEHFYRSTELAFFDAPAWALVPYSMRVASSWNLFNRIALQLRQTLEALGPDARRRDLSYTQLSLDQVGWERVIEAVDTHFTCAFEEQKDARLRVSDPDEELFRADVLLIAFESPMKGRRAGPSLVESDREPLIPFPERLAPVLGDDLSLQIVSELNRREMSVTQFRREFGPIKNIGSLRRRFKRLQASGWLEKVKEETGGRRRGASERFYRATRPAIVDGDAWADLPDSLRETRSWKIFERLSEKIKEAMRAGSFDAREDRYVCWSFLTLDQQGWINVVAEIEALSVLLLEEQKHAEDRLSNSGEQPILVTVGMGAFDAMPDSIKAP